MGKKRIDLLSAGDLWLLLEVAYCHDAGMAVQSEEILRLWRKDKDFQTFIRTALEEDLGDISAAAEYYKQMDNLLTNKKKMQDIRSGAEIEFDRDWPVKSQNYIQILVSEYLRSQHAVRVKRLLRELDAEVETKIPDRLHKLAILVSQMHGSSFEEVLKEIKYATKGFGNGMLHPQFAAAMLRIGDLLDIDNNRFSPYAIKHFGRLPFVSMLHFKKHKAITHLLITEEMIEVEARVEEYEVGAITDEWFHAIDDEVQNLMCYWNQIAPEALRGCTLKGSKCNVYLKDPQGETYHRFQSQNKKEFSINKKKLIKLMIGTSIYAGEIEFFREYIQNAMDASKMQLWLDLKNARYGSVDREKLDEGRLSPFDLDPTVYANYKIDISLSWNYDYDKVQIQIADQGIGIEGAYLNYLSDIGSGWRKREKYTHDIQHMLRWLRPTGGFGIGIQSAFMITDEVEMVTKAECDAYGHRIVLKDQNKGGTVYVEDVTTYPARGTIITILVDTEKIQGWQAELNSPEMKRLFKNHSLRFESETYDEFDPNGYLLFFYQLLCKYIKAIVPNPLLPIEIRCEKMRKFVYDSVWKKAVWQETGISRYRVFFEGSEFQCFIANVDKDDKGNASFFIWSCQYHIYFYVMLPLKRGRFEKSKQMFCFKNILVRDIQEKIPAIYYPYELTIDFMGFPVENCLMLHRNSFTEKFSIDRYVYLGLGAYFTCLQKVKESAVYKPLWECYSGQLIRMVKYYQMLDEDITVENIKKQRVIRYEFVSANDTSKYWIEPISVDKSDQEVLEYLHPFYAQLNTGKLDMSVRPKGFFLTVDDALECDFAKIKDIGIPHGIVARYASGAAVDEMSEGEKERFYILQDLDHGIGIQNGETWSALFEDDRWEKTLVTIMGDLKVLYLRQPEREELKESGYYDYFWDRNDRTRVRKYVTGVYAEQYKKLCVSKLPFAEADHIMDRRYLISPVTIFDVIDVNKKLVDYQQMHYSDFRKMVWGEPGNETRSYQMMIEWTVRHSVEQSSRQEVIDEYERFLRSIYEECIYGQNKQESPLDI